MAFNWLVSLTTSNSKPQMVSSDTRTLWMLQRNKEDSMTQKTQTTAASTTLMAAAMTNDR